MLKRPPLTDYDRPLRHIRAFLIHRSAICGNGINQGDLANCASEGDVSLPVPSLQQSKVWSMKNASSSHNSPRLSRAMQEYGWYNRIYLTINYHRLTVQEFGDFDFSLCVCVWSPGCVPLLFFWTTDQTSFEWKLSTDASCGFAPPPRSVYPGLSAWLLAG